MVEDGFSRVVFFERYMCTFRHNTNTDILPAHIHTQIQTHLYTHIYLTLTLTHSHTHTHSHSRTHTDTTLTYTRTHTHSHTYTHTHTPTYLLLTTPFTPLPAGVEGGSSPVSGHRGALPPSTGIPPPTQTKNTRSRLSSHTHTKE